MFACPSLRPLVCVLPLLVALPACSSSSGAGGTPDGSTSDGSGDTGAATDTGSPMDVSSGDTSTAQDSGSADAGSDGPLPFCGADAACVTGTFCCVGANQGFCDPSCACWTGLGCASAAQCLVNTDVCCIQPTTVGCTAGTQQSVCTPFCSGAGQVQLCDPGAVTNECLQGSCSTDPTTLNGLKIPVDAGYGFCH